MTGGLEVVARYHHLILLVLSLTLLLPLLLLRLAAASTSRRRRGSSCNEQQQEKQLLLPPPSPPERLPIIGHLHLVGSLPHVSLRDLAADHGHGGLMLLHLGAVPNLVASSPRSAEAVLRTHDHVFASRRTSRITDGLVYGSSSIAFSPYGHHWRQARKLVTTHLLTVKKVHSYRCARREEVSLVIAKIREAAAVGVAVDMSAAMNTFSNDIISRAVSGKFFRAEGRNKLFRELVETNSNLFGGVQP